MNHFSSFDLATRDKSSKIQKLLNLDDTGLALDVGSGTGYTTHACLGERPTVCVDLHEPNLRYLLEQAPSYSSKGFLPLGLVADTASLPLRTGSFRFVLCSEVLEHLENDESAVKEISRVLSDEGRAIITVPYSGLRFTGFLEALGIKTVHDYPGPEYHVRPGYDEATLKNLLSKHGLEIEKMDFFLRFFTRMTVDFVSLFHILYQRLRHGRRHWNWADAAQSENSLVFKVYTWIFPVLLGISKLDRFLSKRRGFGIIVVARKKPS